MLFFRGSRSRYDRSDTIFFVPETDQQYTGDYQPQGQVVKFNDVSVYDSQPPVGIELQHATVLLLPDGFGHAKHNYILADRFARSGYRTLIPDYFEGKFTDCVIVDL